MLQSNSSSMLPLLSILALMMEYLERSSRKRKHTDLDDDSEEDDDEEDDDEEDDEKEDEDEEDEEDNDNEEEDHEEHSDVLEQTSASKASDAKSSANLADASDEWRSLRLKELLKGMEEILDEMSQSPASLRIAIDLTEEFLSKLSKQVPKLNGGTNGKL